MNRHLTLTLFLCLQSCTDSAEHSPQVDAGDAAVELSVDAGSCIEHGRCHDGQKLEDSGPLPVASRGDAASNASGPLPASYVQFVPEGETTNAGGLQLGLAVSFFSPQQTKEEVLAALAAALELVRLPSRERVEARVSIDANAAAYTTQVVLTPSLTLSDGWYALRLNPPPARVQLGYYGSAPLDGVPTSRFLVGSGPLIKRIELCDKSDAVTKVLVTFSEQLHATEPLETVISLRAGTSDIECQTPLLASGNGYSGLEVICAGLANVQSLQMSFDGLESPSGVLLTAADGGTPHLALDTMSLLEAGGCRVFMAR